MSINKPVHFLLLSAMFLLCGPYGCCAPQYLVRPAQREREQLVAFMTRLAQDMYNPDWVDYDTDFYGLFSPTDHVRLVDYVDTIEPLVLDGLEQCGGVRAALAAGYLRYQAALPILHTKLLELRAPYLWESSSDYTSEEVLMNDHQYPYHIAYIRAIETITRKPLNESIHLTSEELRRLQDLAKQAHIERPQTIHYCARWLLKKFENDRK